MEDILQFLFIAGFIIISIVGQLKKESKKAPTINLTPLCRKKRLTKMQCPSRKVGEDLMLTILRKSCLPK